MTYIVECSICSQAWEVPRPIFSTPPDRSILLPDHEMLRMADGERMQGVMCPGSQVPGLGLGDRTQWEKNWQSRKGTRPLPSVGDGSGVKLVG